MTTTRKALYALLLGALVLVLTACHETGEHDNNGTGDAGDTATDAESDGEDDAADAGDTEADASACEPACGADEVCDEASGECVECLTAAECDAGDVCSDDGLCVTCTETAGCTGDEVCAVDAADPDASVCVACLEEGDCDDGVCLVDSADPTNNACVECEADSDCTDATASTCNTTTNTCVACTSNDECAGIAAGEVCDTSGDSGVCVECVSDTDCTNGICNQIDQVCTDIQAGSAAACEACVADSQCEADHYCVPMSFNGSSHGNYCLELFSSTVGCDQPFGVLETKTSLGGETAEFCSLNEALTTCEAVESLEAGVSGQCETGGSSDDSLCGASGIDDGLCRTVGGLINKCTYECAFVSDCPSGGGRDTCGNDRNGGTGPEYCGGGI